MPGTFIVRPIEANLTHNPELFGKLKPYCAVSVGATKVQGPVSDQAGKHPMWHDVITVPSTNSSTAKLDVMDKGKFTSDSVIGSCMINLREVQDKGQVHQWYPLTYKNKPAGEILMEVAFQPEYSTLGQTSAVEEKTMGFRPEYDSVFSQTSTAEEKASFRSEFPILDQTSKFEERVSVDRASTFEEKGSVFVEQRQVVEPRTFLKDVDVVEIRPYLKEIEVLEPVKVVKEVLATEAVPVTKKIEIIEPQIVKKMVQVMEPRVVTKTIQVVENVRVIKEVEVIEPKVTVKEIETFEPRTYMKEVEVTEHVPVKKQVEVTAPITVKKAVEYVEPVITTQTIFKEVQPAVVVNEEITTTIGPATLVDMDINVRKDIFVNKVNQANILDRDIKTTEFFSSKSTLRPEVLLQRQRLQEEKEFPKSGNQ